MNTRRFGLLFLIFIVFPAFTFAGGHFRSELIFPPEHWHNHASSLVQTPDGALLVCWYHGSGERSADDVKILGSRLPVGSRTWERPFLMADVPGFPDTNPAMIVDRAGKLFLFWANIVSNQWGSALLRMKTSVDFEKKGPPHWQWQDVILLKPKNLEPQFLAKVASVFSELKKYPEARAEAEEAVRKVTDKLARRLGWMPRVHPLILPGGRILLPLYSDVFSVGLVAISDDSGKTWFGSEPIVGLVNVQPSLVRKKDGTIAAFMRDNGPGLFIQYSESHDNGMHWEEARYLSIPNPGSSVETIALKNGHWVLVCNDTKDGRYRLSALLSEDEGKTWPWKRAIENSPDHSGSYSYPSVIQTRDGKIHVTYSWSGKGGQSIKHAVFDEMWIKTNQGSLRKSK